jgi:hypothetical protein
MYCTEQTTNTISKIYNFRSCRHLNRHCAVDVCTHCVHSQSHCLQSDKTITTSVQVCQERVIGWCALLLLLLLLLIRGEKVVDVSEAVGLVCWSSKSLLARGKKVGWVVGGGRSRMLCAYTAHCSVCTVHSEGMLIHTLGGTV